MVWRMRESDGMALLKELPQGSRGTVARGSVDQRRRVQIRSHPVGLAIRAPGASAATVVSFRAAARAREAAVLTFRATRRPPLVGTTITL